MVRQTVSPSRPGIIQSRIAMRGAPAPTRAASAAVPSSTATTSCPRRTSAASSVRRATGSSSAMRILTPGPPGRHGRHPASAAVAPARGRPQPARPPAAPPARPRFRAPAPPRRRRAHRTGAPSRGACGPRPAGPARRPPRCIAGSWVNPAATCWRSRSFSSVISSRSPSSRVRNASASYDGGVTWSVIRGDGRSAGARCKVLTSGGSAVDGGRRSGV